MELINATRMVAGYTMGLEPSGRELLVIAVKGTFVLPQEGEPLLLADEQMPLVMSDIFFGEPGRSAPRYEAELAPRKQRCDVLLDGSAYAPSGRPTTRTQVGLRVGVVENFTVVGDRMWQPGWSGAITASSPAPFTRLPINYDRAFGGRTTGRGSVQHAAFMRNPIGRGFHKHSAARPGSTARRCQTPKRRQPREVVDADNRPMAFGPIGRRWEPRSSSRNLRRQMARGMLSVPAAGLRRAGYYQSAPLDQQVPYPRGGEEIGSPM